jgi:RimJ/RimL family protein N-acetyltransferase
VGVVGLMTIPWQADFTPAVEIGWRIGSRFRRQGYAAQAARAALGFGFATLGLDKIVAFTVPGNAASWKLMEKLGMRHEGEFDHPRLPEGHHYRRHLLYSLTEARWRDAARLG